MADAPNTSAYILQTPDGADLPNSRQLLGDTPNGIVTNDTGANGTLTITSTGNLRSVSNISISGVLCFNSVSKTFFSRRVLPGDGTISVQDPSGDVNNILISVTPNTSVQQIEVASNGTVASTGSILNFIPGDGAGISVVPNGNRTDVTITAVGGGGSGVNIEVGGGLIGAATTLNFANTDSVTWAANDSGGTISVEATATGGGGGPFVPLADYTAAGDILYGTGAGAVMNLSAGVAGQVLTSGTGTTGTNTPIWTTGGTSGQVLTSTGTTTPPTWTTIGGGGGIVYTDSGNVSPFSFFVGRTAGNTGGSKNTAIGIQALNSSSLSGNSNTAIGDDVLTIVTTGSSNTAIGQNVLSLATINQGNTAIGAGVLYALGGGITSPFNNNNTCIGANIGPILTTSYNNTAVGQGIHTSYISIHDSTFVGFNSGALDTGLSNCGGFGVNAKVGQSSCIIIGSVTSGSIINLGINQSVPLQALHVSAGANVDGTTTNVAAIQMDESTATPATPTGGGLIYIDNNSPSRAKYINSIGTNLFITTSSTPPSATQILVGDSSGNGTWTSSLFDTGNTSPWNLYIGSGTGNSDTAPTYNALVGIDVGSGIETPSLGAGTNNTALGIFTLTALTAGSGNTAIGTNALSMLDVTNANTCMGVESLFKCTGQDNTSVGYGSLPAEAAFNYCTALGFNTGNQNTADHNTFLGYQSGASVVNATYVMLIGDSSDITDDSITNAVAIGKQCTIGQPNAVNIGSNVGVNVGLNKSTPASTLHIGVGSTANLADLRFDQSTATPSALATSSALYVDNTNALWFQPGAASAINISGAAAGVVPFTNGGQLISSTAANTPALVAAGSAYQVLLSTGSASVPVFGSMIYDTGSAGNFNYFGGISAGAIGATGTGNAAVGVAVMNALSSGIGNVGFGQDIMTMLDTGSYNISMGSGNLNALAGGQYNIALSTNALNSLVTGIQNIGIGFQALQNTLGDNNIAIGIDAGQSLANGDGNIFIGTSADLVSGSTLTGGMALGFGAQIAQDYSVNIGFTTASSGAYNVGINHPAPAQSLHIGAGTDGAGGQTTTAAIYFDVSTTPPTSVASNDATLYVEASQVKIVSGTAINSGTVAVAQDTVTSGQATLNGTTGVVITTTAIQTTSIVLVTHSTGTGAPSLVSLGTLAVGSIVAATSFTVYSSAGGDTNTVNWLIINP